MAKSRSLIGKSFLSWNDKNEVHWQGVILARPSPHTYLVQLFGWFTGEPTDQKLIDITEMKNWTFYDTAHDRNFAYEEYDRRRVTQMERQQF